MKSKKLNTKNVIWRSTRHAFLCLFFACSSIGFSQNTPTVKTTVDTTAIKIGEQIHFKIIIETDSTDLVIFPEGQTFSPLETVEAYKTDTTWKKDRITLQKIYALTQFDSGVYKLPAQRIEINGKAFFTDSLQVNVATVAVDTTAQKMYDIKPLIEVEKSSSEYWRLGLWIFGALLILFGLLYWFVIREKPLTEEEKVALLPPYDRALLELKNLENSKYLIQDEYKKYYSELTDIVRSYLEEDVKVSALESTTDQLINRLELLKDSGKLDLDKDTIIQFKRILQTADLVKFAKSKPETSVAEQDRKSVEQIVIKTKEAIPEPTIEELQEEAEYQEELARKKQKKKLVYIGITAAAAVLISIISLIAYYGFEYSKDTILGHPTKRLLEGEWVSSSYGFPPISLETPEVLIRQEVKLPPEAKAQIKEMQVFELNGEKGLISISTMSSSYTQEVEPDHEKAVEDFIKRLENSGVKNITTKQEEFTTISAVKGLKVYGSGKFKVPGSKELITGKYIVLSFGGKGFHQIVFLKYIDDNPYAKQIIDRILTSVDVKSAI